MVIALVAPSYGSVQISWTSAAGFVFSATPWVGILGDGTGKSTFAQLVYSVDLYADAADVGGVTTGDDVVWDTINILEDGIANDSEMFDSRAWFLDGFYTNAFVSGHVYARIFQDSGAEAGDWYFYTPMYDVKDVTGIDPPQSLELNTIAGLTDPFGTPDTIDSGPTVAQVVPEPAAIGLIGLGGIITLTASRIRRRNAR